MMFDFTMPERYYLEVQVNASSIEPVSSLLRGMFHLFQFINPPCTSKMHNR